MSAAPARKRLYRADFTASGYVEYEATDEADAQTIAQGLVRFGVPEPVAIAWYSGTELGEVYEVPGDEPAADLEVRSSPATEAVHGG